MVFLPIKVVGFRECRFQKCLDTMWRTMNCISLIQTVQNLIAIYTKITIERKIRKVD